jgi:hypothetical protein
MIMKYALTCNACSGVQELCTHASTVFLSYHPLVALLRGAMSLYTSLCGSFVVAQALVCSVIADTITLYCITVCCFAFWYFTVFISHIVWLHSLVKCWGMWDYARARYVML